MVGVTKEVRRGVLWELIREATNLVWRTLYEEKISTLKTQRMSLLAKIMLAAVTNKPLHFSDNMNRSWLLIHITANVMGLWVPFQWFRYPDSLHPAVPSSPGILESFTSSWQMRKPLGLRSGMHAYSHIPLGRSSHMAPPGGRGLGNIVVDLTATVQQ